MRRRGKPTSRFEACDTRPNSFDCACTIGSRNDAVRDAERIFSFRDDEVAVVQRDCVNCGQLAIGNDEQQECVCTLDQDVLIANLRNRRLLVQFERVEPALSFDGPLFSGSWRHVDQLNVQLIKMNGRLRKMNGRLRRVRAQMMYSI